MASQQLISSSQDLTTFPLWVECKIFERDLTESIPDLQEPVLLELANPFLATLPRRDDLKLLLSPDYRRELAEKFAEDEIYCSNHTNR